METKILVPVDGSEYSDKALNHAVFIAEGLKAEIVLLNVQPSFNTRNINRFFQKSEIEEFQKEMSEDAFQHGLAILEKTNLSFSTQLRIGVPATEICSVASEENVTFIIMGSRGLGAVKSKILGSVSYSVLHEAPCPVTIVP